jgi:hypothetical protein
VSSPLGSPLVPSALARRRPGLSLSLTLTLQDGSAWCLVTSGFLAVAGPLSGSSHSYLAVPIASLSVTVSILEDSVSRNGIDVSKRNGF